MSKPEKTGGDMRVRVVSGAILIALTLVCMALCRPTRLLYLTAFGILAAREMCGALGQTGRRCFASATYFYLFGHGVLCWLGADLLWCGVLFFAAGAAVVCAGVFGGVSRAGDVQATLSALVYPCVPFAFLISLSAQDYWIPVFVLGCVATWVCDSFALFGGRRLGKRKLAPEISPKKTVEGAVCGAVSSVAAGVIIYFVLRSCWDIPLWLCALSALLGSTLGQLGDLTASLFKRTAGLKDYSNLIPGHGGALDRTDSLLFAVPMVFICLYAAGAL